MAAATPVAAQTPDPSSTAPAPDPAPAPTEPTTTTTTPATSPQAIELATALSRNYDKLATVQRDLTDTQVRLAAAEAALADTMQRLVATQARITELRDQLQGRAAILYQNRGSEVGAILNIDQIQSIASSEHYAEAAAGFDNRSLDEFRKLQATQEKERAERDSTRAQIADDKARLDSLQSQLTAAVEQEKKLLDRLGGITVMGDSQLTATQMAAWFKSTDQPLKLAGGVTIDEFTQIYIDEGNAERVRGDMAFAQSVLETGSFSVAPGNNFAGIGTCDSCEHGLSFPTPRDGVRAQIQLLRNYADPDSRVANLANPPSPELYTPPSVYDTAFLKGKVPLWNQMGNGNWATAPDYFVKVLLVYETMFSWVKAHPGIA